MLLFSYGYRETLILRLNQRFPDISRIEKGQTMPSMAALAKIAHGLGKRLEIRFV